jgi:putative oxidoreductase
MITMIARIGLGLIFLVLGLNGFFFFIPTPAIAGYAAAFFNTMIESHYSVMVFGVQIIAAIMLLSDRYVPLALVTLAAVLANILDYHITMLPSGLPLPLFTTLLWFIVAWPLRSHFALLFTQRVAARS